MSKLRNVIVPSVKQFASKYGVDFNLLDAIIQVESDYQIYAVRFEPECQYKLSPDKYARSNNTTEITELTLQRCSWGLCQIMGFKAREMYFSGPLPSLCDLEINLDLGAKILRETMKRYPKLEDQIATYNAGSPRKTTFGRYLNQDYVDKVLKRMRSDETV